MTTDISELFARDPHTHTDADIRQIVDTLREARSKFIADGGRPRASAKEPTKTQKELTRLDLNIKL